jgi:hypothetical protein
MLFLAKVRICGAVQVNGRNLTFPSWLSRYESVTPKQARFPGQGKHGACPIDFTPAPQFCEHNHGDDFPIPEIEWLLAQAPTTTQFRDLSLMLNPRNPLYYKDVPEKYFLLLFCAATPHKITTKLI